MGLSAAKAAAPQSAETLDAPARRSTSVLTRPGEVLARRAEVLAKRSCECGATAGFSGRCGACDGLSIKAPGENAPGAGANWPQPAAARHDIAHLDARPTAQPRPLTPLRAQTQLRVAEPGDSAEYEAQEIGRRVVAMPAPSGPPDSTAAPLRRTPAGSVQRRAIQPLLASPSVVKGIDTSRGHGAPLAAQVRSFMEPRFGADFSGVRVHTGPEAAALNSQLNAHAFTVGRDIYFNEGQYRPDSGAGRELIAHELTHTIQQGGVIQRSASEAPVSERTGESLHRSIWDDIKSGASGIVNALGDPLAFLADKANMIPGFRMLTIVIGANPITMAKVDPTPANILMALIEFIPGGGLITQALQNSGVFDKVGNWIAARVKELVANVGVLKAAVTSFVGSLKVDDIANPAGVWDRAKRIFTEPIDRLIAFCKGVITDILKFIKDAILLPLAKLAEGTPSWDLLCAVLGKNPITGEAVDGSPEVLIGGFMKLIGQEEIWQNMQKANAIPRAFAWFKGAMAAVKAFVSVIPGKFKELFTSLTIEDVVLVAGAFKKVASVFGGFVANFMSWGLNAIWNLLEIIFDVVSPGAFAYVKKTGAALHDILKNPLPFVGNLIKAAKLGFTNFASNIVDHLKAGLIDWLTGSLPGVYIPQAFTVPEFGKLAISVLGLSWAQIRGKIVKALGPRGETIMKGLETAFDVVKALISGGVAAAWELVKEKLTGLKDMVIDAIIGFVKSAIIEKAIPKLIAMFIPGAGFISAIVSIYDTIKVFIEKLAKIAEVVKSFVDSIVAIAAGEIGGAAKRVEGALGGLLSLAISFFAGFVGLGNVASKIRDAIKKVWDMVDKGLDLAVNFIVGKAKGLFASLFGGKDVTPEEAQKKLNSGLAAGKTAVTRFAGKRVGAIVLKPLLAVIRLRYGLTSLEPVNRNGVWHVRGTINPEGEVETDAKAESPEAAAVLSSAAALAATISAAAANGRKAIESGQAREDARRTEEAGRTDVVSLPTKRPGEESGPGLDVASLGADDQGDVLELMEVKGGKTARAVKSRASSRPIPAGAVQIPVPPGPGSAAKAAADPATAAKIVNKEAVLVKGGRLVQNQLSGITENLKANINKMYAVMKEGVTAGTFDAETVTRVQNIINGQGGTLKFVIDIEQTASMSPDQLAAAKALIQAAFDGLMSDAEANKTKLEVELRKSK
jgi:hypothetical protein